MGPPYWAHLDESPVDYREARYGLDECASDDAVFARSLRGCAGWLAR
ncbi:hypothetical protein [Sphingomonas pokkalii]|nr:hypothetical protein [Sphingomonas pokkalii]